MKSAVSALALSGALLATRAYADGQQSLNLATERLENIQSITYNLSNAIDMWNNASSNPLGTALNNIHLPATNLVTYIDNSTTFLEGYPATFDTTQSFELGTPTQRLAYAVNATVAHLIRKQPEFNASLTSQIVEGDLNSLLAASEKFATVLINFVPTGLQPVALALKSQIIDSLNQGVNCFTANNTEQITMYCNDAIINPNRTFDLAVSFGAIKPDGAPIA